MRILHIMASNANGGAETYSTDVMLSLHNAGVEQCVVMHKKAPRFIELREAGLRLAPRVLSIPFLPLQKLRIRRLISEERPDVVHCWMRRAATLVGRNAGGDRDLSASNPGRARHTIGWFGGYYDPAKFKSCDHFVGVTRDIVKHMIQHGVPESRAAFIPTFPDITQAPAIDRASVNTAPDAKVALALSRLHPKKGLDTLLAALKDVPGCILWLAGEGPLHSKLEAQARELGVMERVRFLGWRTDRAALLRAADVCVLPSRYEPFGTVILEAWAAKTPLVACASAGPAATIEDDVTGLLTPIDDVPALAGALRRALDDENLRSDLVANGYAAYLKGYTREAVTRQWIDYYRSLAA